MTNPRWYKSRLKSWSKPKVKSVVKVCEQCKTEMSLTPAGFVCYYCQFSEVEEA
jgi:hypothetical protein